MKKKRFFALLLITILLLSCYPISASPLTAIKNNDDILDEIEKLINEHMDAQIRKDVDEQERIESAIESLGVKRLSSEDIQRKILGENGFFEDNSVNPRIETPPNSNKYIYYSYRTTCYYNDKNYELQYLFCEPRDTPCLLLENYGYIHRSTSETTLATLLNVTKIIGFASASSSTGLLGTIAITAFDAISSIISNLSPSAVVLGGTSIAIQCSNRVVAKLCYVKKVGQSDDKQKLSFAATRCRTDIGYQFMYSHNSTTHFIQKTTFKDTIAPNYDIHSDNIILSYLGYTSQNCSFVNRVEIRGAGKNNAEQVYFVIWPACPTRLTDLLY